jgi:hypothetical protein
MDENMSVQNSPASGGKNKPINYKILAGIVILTVAAFFLWHERGIIMTGEPMTFSDSFSEGETLEEASKIESSKNSRWWVNSGALAEFKDGILETNQGDLAKDSKWRKLYAKNNSRDTEDGYQPQNIFRLVTRDKWEDLEQTLYFRINKTSLSESDYRNESNGVLLFNRYMDGDDLYYTGLRVDGHAVIKKKIADKYYTIKEKEVFTNGEKYDIVDNPSILPENSWIGIRSEIRNIDDDTVNLKLYVDKGQKGDWQLVLETQDEGDKYGKNPFLDEGYAGIRTDFMDAEFKDYRIFELE